MSTTLQTTLTPCSMCSSPSTHVCPRCVTPYCSKPCQETDWPVHKLLCKAFSEDFTTAKRPHPFCVRALYFDEYEDRPHFYWHSYTCDAEAMTFTLAPPHVLNDMTNFTLTSGFTNNRVLGRPVGKRIQLGFRMRPDFVQGKSEQYGARRKSFAKIDAELEQSARGPTVAIGMFRDEKEKVEKPIDLNMADFRHIVDHWRFCYDQDAPARLANTPGEEVQGVRVNCLGDVAVFRRPEFRQTAIDLANFPLESTTPLYSPERLGLPYVFGRYPIALSWKGRSYGGFAAQYNPAHGCLRARLYDQMVTMPSTTGLFTNNFSGQGSIYVVRKDKKPLVAAHVEALASFLGSKLKEYVKDLEDRRNEGAHLSEYLDKLSKDDFLRWYEEGVEERKGERPELAVLSSPHKT